MGIALWLLLLSGAWGGRCGNATAEGVLERVGGVYRGLIVTARGDVVKEIAYFLTEPVRIEVIRSGCDAVHETYHFDVITDPGLDPDGYRARAMSWLEQMIYKDGAAHHRDQILRALARATPAQRASGRILAPDGGRVSVEVRPSPRPERTRVTVQYEAAG